MADFPGLLARDFGFRPQGKSAPMAASKSTTGNISSGGSLNFGIGSGDDTGSSSFSSNRAKRDWNSNSVGNSVLDDHEDLFRSTGNQKTNDYGGVGDYSDVFGGPPKYTNPLDGRGSVDSTFASDSIFHGSKDSGASAKTSSSPVYDKPVYDDDIFDGVPGLKSSSSVNYEYVFSSITSPPKQSANYDDLLGNLGRTETELKSSSGMRSRKVEKNVSDFDDLIPGFGGSSPPKNRTTRETSQLRQPTVPSTKSSSNVMEDPFVVLESTSVPAYASSGLFTDPLEQINKPNNTGSAKFDGSSVSGVFDDLDPLDGLTKSSPSFPYDMNNRGKDKSPVRTGTNTTSIHTSAGIESTEKPSLQTTGNASQKVDKSPKSEENFEAVDDVWLTVSEIPLFTQPTSAPPPSRPPPKPVQVSKADNSSFSAVDTKKKVNKFSSFQHSTQNFQSPKIFSDSARNVDVSSVDELEDFTMGRPRNNADERVDVLSSEEELDTNSAAAASAAAMKEAMDRAEAKFKHAREVRERENTKAVRSRDAAQQEKDEKTMQDAQERDLREKQERLNREQEHREREEKEREQRRDKERERAREIERERLKARQAVERATREARERAGAEARLKAERAAVGKATAEARGRAERVAVQRVQAEARERAAAEARERAERAAAEARERANAEARERAAVARAEAEVRLRAERAAVDRAAAEARERAAAAARENKTENENDLESFFGMGARPTSAPKTRTTTYDADAQFQNKAVPEGARRPSTGTSSSTRKASSTTKFVDDFTSVFGGAPSAGEFQEIEGESEERRRARLERQHRTQERAAKALAEKNQRDLQTQWDQAERHRIAETVDVEIKRWAAGKEGNLRALLSTLQYVLWPECGWQAVSLTDLITAASVKKVYRKATLCIHPDKVQQKGANIQQKYIAEKVFDLLKEAWNKLNSEELF